MSHNLGRLVPDGRTLDQNTGLDLSPTPGPLGGPRFVVLHFSDVQLTGTATLAVDLGYGTDTFNSSSGAGFWSRPVDTAQSPISIRITGGTGSARLLEYGSGEPTITGMPGDPCGSRSNPDVFLHTNPYQEPIYESRLECTPGFAWQNAACLLPSVADVVRERVAAATGLIVMVHDGHVSSCSGTLIAADLFLTARHCLTDPAGEDVRSASVTFDYATLCDGHRSPGHTTRFFKVLDEVASGGTSDWVVLRLDAAPGTLPAPLEMRDAALMNGEVVFTMHHPNGAVKKTQAGMHGGGASIVGFDFAGGSSGSALFDVNGKLVRGPLSTGGSCSAPGSCTVGYTAISPVKNALANPPAPAVPLDVMLVFDRSGSMSSSAPPIGRTKLEEAKDAAALFVQLVRQGQGDRMGLVTFSSGTSLPRPLDVVATVKPLLVGPPPFTGGDIAGIAAGGSTSIGGGLLAALNAYGATTNDRAILLLTDGLQNTAPMVEQVETSLGTTKLCVIGFGSDAEINGPLLSRVAREHDGDFTRATDGMALRKFFGLCFGNIFESGALGDPEFVLPAKRGVSERHPFSVCGEERITLILGWDDPSTPLRAELRTPSGKVVGTKRTETARGRTWAFWRVPLPHEGERDGTWSFVVDRVPSGGEFGPLPTDVRYFFLIVCSGGPTLTYCGERRRFYTGDTLEPLVALRYPNGTAPKGEVMLTIEAPTIALGHLTSEAGLRPPTTSVDAVDAFHATLQAVARDAGGVLPVSPKTVTVPLFDDGSHHDGAMEPDGVYGDRLEGLTRAEGTYHFRAVATYGTGCRATREAIWSIHVEPGIDPEHTDVSLVGITERPDGHHGTLILVPRDPYGNPLGPGRPDVFSVSPLPGVRVDGAVSDRGDGSYAVDVTWHAGAIALPGMLVHQPDRDPIPVTPPTTAPKEPAESCTGPAEDLLECLGLRDPDVECVRVTSVSLEVDLARRKCRKDPRC